MKRVNAILVNDVHLDRGNGELVKDIFHQLVDLCKQMNVSRIICGGDVFTQRSGQPLQCLTDWKEILAMLYKERIELHVIPGNHDKTSSMDERSYLDVYEAENVFLYRKATTVIMGKVCYMFAPYFREDKWMEDYQRELEHMATCSDDIGDRPRILISHIGFDGVRNNDGSMVSSPIKPSDFKQWDKVLLGHYHNASEVADNVIYTGSAYQNNFGEDITDKGFTLIYEDGSIKHVESHFPRYIRKTIDAKDKETLRNLMEQYEGETYDHIRFVIVGKKEDCQTINVTELQSKGIDVKFKSTEETEAIEISEDDSVLCYDARLIQRDFFKFCSENGIKGAKMKYGLDLLKEALA